MDFRASGVRSLKLNIFLILKEVKTNLILRSASQKRLSNCRSLKKKKKKKKKKRNVNDENNTRYFKLPFIGRYSRIAELKLRQLLKRFCEADLNIKLVFTSFKIKNMFSFKDRTPDALKSMVVYQFICTGCNSCYIGETSRHFSTRIKEHTVSDKNSHIFKHFSQFPSC